MGAPAIWDDNNMSALSWKTTVCCLGKHQRLRRRPGIHWVVLTPPGADIKRSKFFVGATGVVALLNDGPR